MGNCINKRKNFEEPHDKNVKLQDIKEVDIFGTYSIANPDILKLKTKEYVWNPYSLFQPDKQKCISSLQIFNDIDNLTHIDNCFEFDLKTFSKTLDKTLLELKQAPKLQNITSKEINIKKYKFNFKELSPKLKSFTNLGDYPVKLQIVFLKFDDVYKTKTIALGNEEKTDNMTNVLIQKINYSSGSSYNDKNKSFQDCIQALIEKKKDKYKHNTVCVKYVFDKNDQINDNLKNLFKDNLIDLKCIQETVFNFEIQTNTNFVDFVDNFFQNKKQYIKNNVPETAFVLSCLLLSLKNKNEHAFDYLCLALESPNNYYYILLNKNNKITSQFRMTNSFYNKVELSIYYFYETYKDSLGLESVTETKRILINQKTFFEYCTKKGKDGENFITLWAEGQKLTKKLEFRNQKLNLIQSNKILLEENFDTFETPEIQTMWIRKLNGDKYNEWVFKLPSKFDNCFSFNYEFENKKLFLKNKCLIFN